MFSRIIIVVLFCLPAQAASQLGLLTLVSGKVEILRAGEKASLPARPADFIEPGSRVVTGPRSETVFLFCPQRRSARILENSEVEFEAGQMKVLKGKISEERDLPTCHLPEGLVLSSASRMQSGTLRMRGLELALISPSHTKVSLLQPEFRWNPVEDATRYELRLLDQAQNILWSQDLSGTEAKIPPEASVLSLGGRYWWRVTALDQTGIVSEAGSDFQVLPRENAEVLRVSDAALRRLMEENPKDAGPLYLLAFLYEENGVLDEAARIYGEIARQPEAQAWIRVHLSDLMKRLGWQSLDPVPWQ